MILTDSKIVWGIFILVVVLYIFNTYSGLDNVSGTAAAPVVQQQIATTGSVPMDQEAKTFVDQIEEYDVDTDLMTAGINYNINTTPTNSKNRNLQLRPDPVVTQIDTGYFNNSVIMPDYTEKNVFG